MIEYVILLLCFMVGGVFGVFVGYKHDLKKEVISKWVYTAKPPTDIDDIQYLCVTQYGLCIGRAYNGELFLPAGFHGKYITCYARINLPRGD